MKLRQVLEQGRAEVCSLQAVESVQGRDSRKFEAWCSDRTSLQSSPSQGQDPWHLFEAFSAEGQAMPRPSLKSLIARTENLSDIDINVHVLADAPSCLHFAMPDMYKICFGDTPIYQRFLAHPLLTVPPGPQLESSSLSPKKRPRGFGVSRSTRNLEKYVAGSTTVPV